MIPARSAIASPFAFDPEVPSAAPLPFMPSPQHSRRACCGTPRALTMTHVVGHNHAHFPLLPALVLLPLLGEFVSRQWKTRLGEASSAKSRWHPYRLRRRYREEMVPVSVPFDARASPKADPRNHPAQLHRSSETMAFRPLPHLHLWENGVPCPSSRVGGLAGATRPIQTEG